ncbi:MAG: SMC-Scp complex subunit ScpB [Pseudomonadota bacterium]
MSDVEGLVPILEAALMAAGKPLSLAALGALFEEPERPAREDLQSALAAIGERCDGRGFELVEVASGFRFQVREQYSTWVGRLWHESPQKYSRALLETLALIAYRQPITRGEIEEIRGVAVSTNIIRTLHERDWIRVVGHRDVPGRPAMYATTRQFLDYFSLKSLDQLPALADIRDLETLNAELGFDPLPDESPNEASQPGADKSATPGGLTVVKDSADAPPDAHAGGGETTSEAVTADAALPPAEAPDARAEDVAEDIAEATVDAAAPREQLIQPEANKH